MPFTPDVVRRPHLVAAWLGAMGILAAAPPGARAQTAPATGSIRGSVRLSSAVTARRPRIRLYADFGPGALPPTPTVVPNEMSNVVVYLDSATGDAGQSNTPPPQIGQQDEAFVPHVLAVTVGTRVEFPNEDPFFHNVFSLSQTKTFDLGRYPKGRSKSVLFDQPGIVQVFCHIHADMSAIVLVRGNPWFATPDTTGHFTISGIPPGQYRIVGWHERARPVTQVVRVAAGRTAPVELNIPVADRPQRND